MANRTRHARNPTSKRVLRVQLIVLDGLLCWAGFVAGGAQEILILVLEGNRFELMLIGLGYYALIGFATGLIAFRAWTSSLIALWPVAVMAYASVPRWLIELGDRVSVGSLTWILAPLAALVVLSLVNLWFSRLGARLRLRLRARHATT